MSETPEGTTPKSIEQHKSEIALLRASLESFASNVAAKGEPSGAPVVSEPSPDPSLESTPDTVFAVDPVAADEATRVPEATRTIDLTAFDDHEITATNREASGDFAHAVTFAGSFGDASDEPADESARFAGVGSTWAAMTERMSASTSPVPPPFGERVFGDVPHPAPGDPEPQSAADATPADVPLADVPRSDLPEAPASDDDVHVDDAHGPTDGAGPTGDRSTGAMAAAAPIATPAPMASSESELQPKRGFIGELRSAVNRVEPGRRKKIAGLLLVGWLALIAVNMTAIRTKVEHSLENSSRKVLVLNGQPGIAVDASGLTVKLTGYVETAEDRDRAASLVKARFGVRRVVNSLVVDPAKAAGAATATDAATAGGTATGGSKPPGGSTTPVATLPATTLPLRGPTVVVVFTSSPDGTVSQVDVRGTVPDAIAKEALFARLSSVVPIERISSSIVIPTTAIERADMTAYRRLGSFLEIVAKSKAPDVTVSYDSGNLAVSGTVGDAGDLALLRAEARNLVGTGTIADTLLATNADGSPSEQPGDTTAGSTTTVAGGPVAPSTTSPLQIDGVGRTDSAAAKTAQSAVDAVISGQVIGFEKNKARLTNEGRQVLNALATVLLAANDRSVKYEISGHTDDKGSDAANLDLSTRRAEAVRDALVEKGVSTDRLVARGYGETRPIASNDTEAGRSQNRRIEVRAAS